jgi:NAD(P)-dependent dehydrogenase (short-subunit alcohol dehydrogenase family)
MKVSKNPSIINIASIYGSHAPDWKIYEGTDMSNPAAYAVSKAGLIQLTRWLATTVSPEIRVNAISPGGIVRNQPKKFIESYSEKTPLRRMATEEDMVGALIFLAADLSLYVTGQVLAVDGGWGL